MTVQVCNIAQTVVRQMRTASINAISELFQEKRAEYRDAHTVNNENDSGTLGVKVYPGALLEILRAEIQAGRHKGKNSVSAQLQRSSFTFIVCMNCGFVGNKANNNHFVNLLGQTDYVMQQARGCPHVILVRNTAYVKQEHGGKDLSECEPVHADLRHTYYIDENLYGQVWTVHGAIVNSGNVTSKHGLPTTKVVTMGKTDYNIFTITWNQPNPGGTPADIPNLDVQLNNLVSLIFKKQLDIVVLDTDFALTYRLDDYSAPLPNSLRLTKIMFAQAVRGEVAKHNLTKEDFTQRWSVRFRNNIKHDTSYNDSGRQCCILMIHNNSSSIAQMMRSEQLALIKQLPGPHLHHSLTAETVKRLREPLLIQNFEWGKSGRNRDADGQSVPIHGDDILIAVAGIQRGMASRKVAQDKNLAKNTPGLTSQSGVRALGI